MATINYRTGIPQAVAINGVDAGGAMRIYVDEGFEERPESAPDGLEVTVQDKISQYCRGTLETQDWVELINIFSGTLGTYIFYERISGVAELAGYVKHTLTNPVIHAIRLQVRKGQYALITCDFECLAADETKGFADMHTQLDAQAVPTYISAARGGFRVTSATHGGTPVSFYHVTAFDFAMELDLVKECNDADVGYTCVDARLSGMTPAGSITFQDQKVTTANLTAQALLAASPGPLVLQLVQRQGATAQVVTIARVDFKNMTRTVQAQKGGFAETVLNYAVNNDPTTPLTVAGVNKIITIAAAA